MGRLLEGYTPESESSVLGSGNGPRALRGSIV
jgi:hypothetical protein